MRTLLAAFQFLTILPWPKSAEIKPADYARSSALFPLVGIYLGLVLGLANLLFEAYLSSEILSVILVTGLILMTRAVHLAGLKNTFDEFQFTNKLAESSSTIRERRVKIYGFLAILMVIVLKVRAIEVMGEARTLGLLLSPVLARWSIVVLAHGSLPAPEGPGNSIVEHVRGLDLLFATTLALILVTSIAGKLGLWIALWISLFALLGKTYLHRRIGGVSQDSLGAVAELSETLALLLFSSL